MNRYISVAMLTLAAWAAPAPAQTPSGSGADEAAIRTHYQTIDPAVVRLRTLIEAPAGRTDSSHRSAFPKPLEIQGTGVIVGQLLVDGRAEYLVLTNHHVADPSNYILSDGPYLRENRQNTRALPRAPEQTFLVRSEDDDRTAEDIRLVEIARNVRGDMTLLHTVNAPEGLPLFDGRIGYSRGQVRPGARVITSGFPSGQSKLLDAGTIVEVGRHHALGQPHEDVVLSLPVKKGQSGSPVFLVETIEIDGTIRPHFTLIGLLHASENGETYMVPYSLWKGSMAGVAAALQGRLAR